MGSIDATSWPVVGLAIVIWLIFVLALVRRVRVSASLVSLRLVVWSLTLLSALVLVLESTGKMPDVPSWFEMLAVLPIVGIAIGIVGGKRLRATGMIGAAVCVVLGLVAAILIANEHYAYWPTIDALLGKEYVDPVMASSTMENLLAVRPISSSIPRPAMSTARNDHGTLIPLDIPGPTSGFRARKALIWVPPAFLRDPDHPRPVVEFVGGTPSWPSDWTRAGGLDVLADRYARIHDGEAPILVMVDANGSAFGDTECVDSQRGNAESYLVTDVPRFMSQHFSTSSQWAIAGYSEGGTCALTLALRHPDRFRSFVDLAGDAGPNLGSTRHTIRALFGGSRARWTAYDPESIIRSGRVDGVEGWIAAGNGDLEHRRCAERLTAAARDHGLPIRFHGARGGHDFRFVHRALTDAVPWLFDTVGSPSTTT